MYGRIMKTHNYKGCGSKDLGRASCTKGKKQARVSGVVGRELKKCVAAVVDVRAIANETKSLHQFINDYPYLPAPPRSNTTTTRLRLPDLNPAKGISPLLPSPLHGQICFERTPDPYKFTCR